MLDFESWSPPVPLRRWADTDCWYAEVRMPARLRVTYRFLVEGAAHADPFNPVGSGADRSIAATPDAPAQPHWPSLGPDDVPPLPRTRIRWSSDRLGERRTVRVHPAGGGGPLVLLLDGDDWLCLHPAVTAFDAAVAAGELPPVTLVFLPAKDREAELGCRPELREAVRDDLLPLVADAGVAAAPGEAGGRRAESGRAERAVRGAGVPGPGVRDRLPVGVVLVVARCGRAARSAGRGGRGRPRGAAACGSRVVGAAVCVRRE